MAIVASFLKLSLLPELHDVVKTLRNVFWNMTELRNVVDKALLLCGNRIQLAKSLVHGLQFLILILIDHAVDNSQRIDSSILRSLTNQSTPFRLQPWDCTREEPRKRRLSRIPCAEEHPEHGALRCSHSRRMWPHGTYLHGQQCSPYGKHGDTSNRWNTWRLEPGSNKTGKSRQFGRQLAQKRHAALFKQTTILRFYIIRFKVSVSTFTKFREVCNFLQYENCTNWLFYRDIKCNRKMRALSNQNTPQKPTVRS